MLALSFGIAALLAWDREDRHRGHLDLRLPGSGRFNLHGRPANSVAIAFAVVLDRRRDRLWVGAVPIVPISPGGPWVMSVPPTPPRGGGDLLNIRLLPAWSFGGISGVLALVRPEL